MQNQLKILFLAAEAEPFVKVGGLGDVAGALPRALHELAGVEVRLAIPFHGAIQRQAYELEPVISFTVPGQGAEIPVDVLTTTWESLQVYFISGPPINPDEPVYSGDNARDGYKFTYFSIAAIELLRRIEWIPDIVHANDWHTAPALYELHLRQEMDPLYRPAIKLMGLHNLPFLGAGAEQSLPAFGLPPLENSSLPWWAISLPLPVGLASAEHIVTVSPHYAREILTSEFGSGLEEFLNSRSDSISGILNGIDVSRWSPDRDDSILYQYSIESIERRRSNKQALTQSFGLDPDPRIPLLATVSRMDPQKGIDLIPDTLAEIADEPWQAILLGTGIPALEAQIRRLEATFPNRVRTAIRFDRVLSHRIFAGADILMIPSRYEPCGLTQMVAMRYGCIPVARATGGLVDTIRDHNHGTPGDGFLFSEASSPDFANAIRQALHVYTNVKEWGQIQSRGMSHDFSWDKSAREYLKLYQQLAGKREAPG